MSASGVLLRWDFVAGASFGDGDKRRVKDSETGTVILVLYRETQGAK